MSIPTTTTSKQTQQWKKEKNPKIIGNRPKRIAQGPSPRPFHEEAHICPLFFSGCGGPTRMGIHVHLKQLQQHVTHVDLCQPPWPSPIQRSQFKVHSPPDPAASKKLKIENWKKRKERKPFSLLTHNLNQKHNFSIFVKETLKSLPFFPLSLFEETPNFTIMNGTKRFGVPDSNPETNDSAVSTRHSQNP